MTADFCWIDLPPRLARFASSCAGACQIINLKTSLFICVVIKAVNVSRGIILEDLIPGEVVAFAAKQNYIVNRTPELDPYF